MTSEPTPEAADRSDLGLRPREQRVLRRKMHDNELFLLDFNVDLATSEDNGRRSPVFTLHHIRPDAVHEDILAAFDAINALRELHFLIYCSISCILETLHIVRGPPFHLQGGEGGGGGWSIQILSQMFFLYFNPVRRRAEIFFTWSYRTVLIILFISCRYFPKLLISKIPFKYTYH